jgi:hypothetical protein
MQQAAEAALSGILTRSYMPESRPSLKEALLPTEPSTRSTWRREIERKDVTNRFPLDR